MTQARGVFPLCEMGRHSECMWKYAEVKTTDGQVLPAVRCSCECGHEAQREREVPA